MGQRERTNAKYKAMHPAVIQTSAKHSATARSVRDNTRLRTGDFLPFGPYSCRALPDAKFYDPRDQRKRQRPVQRKFKIALGARILG